MSNSGSPPAEPGVYLKEIKMENIKKEPESQKFLDFNNDMTLLVVPIQHPQAWQCLVMSG